MPFDPFYKCPDGATQVKTVNDIEIAVIDRAGGDPREPAHVNLVRALSVMMADWGTVVYADTGRDYVELTVRIPKVFP